MKKITWVLVADGGQADVYTFDKKGHLVMVPALSAEGPHQRTREIGSDQPGRAFAAAGSANRSSIEPKTDLERLAKEQFLAGVLETLEGARAAGQFEQLVLVAPPRALGAIRDALPAKLAAAVIAESAHDYTGHNVNDIRDHVVAVAGVKLG